MAESHRMPQMPLQQRTRSHAPRNDEHPARHSLPPATRTSIRRQPVRRVSKCRRSQ